MSDKEQREPKRRRRVFLGGLGRMVQPPLTTPQWKDAIREDEARGPKKKDDPRER
ncbi:MAG TPA: hypothetical protein VJU60_01090 [Thermoleophilaceae bacterium]|nr:hypothetical protein [Thermoleophilaceae bacterium]